MAIISIVGNVDKRVLVIPLARALSIDGKTALITDDNSYKRLYVENENKGNISGIDILIDYNINNKSISLLEDTHENYKHQIYVSEEFKHIDSNLTIICRGVDRRLITDTVADIVSENSEDNKCKEIVITVGAVDKKDMAKTLKVTEKHLLYIHEIEETKTLKEPNDTVLSKKIASIVGKDADIPEKTLEKLINRKQVIDVKELTGRSSK